MSAPGARPQEDNVGRYRVIAELGRGGMARVLLTVSAGPGGFEKLLVVKKLRDELLDDPEFLTMFLDEARIAARLNHPNVVHTYEVGAEGGVYYIAMDYLEGQPLSAILKKVGRQSVPLDVHVRILADMLAGLDYAHKLTDFDGTPLHVVHRDVSPQNVFVTYDGQVKLVDFGIAKAAVASSRTKQGVLKGKAAYIAPEQARAEQVDARADIFAAGVMLFEAIAGRRFAQASNEIALIAARIQGLEPRISDAVPDAPEALARICDRAMAHDRDERFASAAEMREALEAWLEAQPARAGQRELAAFVAGAFIEDREKLRAKIDEQLKRLRSGERGSMTLLQLDVGAEGTPSRESEVMVQTSAATVQLTPAAAKPAGRSWVPALALASVVVIGGAVVLAQRSLSSPGGGDPGAASAPAPAAGSVDVVLRYSPGNAEVTLDGARVEGNPFRGRFPRDGSVHHVEVRAQGFRAERRVLSFERDHELTIDLARDEASGPVSAASAAPPEPAATPPEPGGRTGGAAPGSRKPPAQKPQHSIDEKNPYGK